MAMPAQSSQRLVRLEAEAESEFTCQRARNVRAGWIDESGRSTEVVVTVLIFTVDVRVDVIAVISAIGQVECLSHDLHVGFFAYLEVLAQSRIKLGEGISTEVVERHQVATSSKVAGLPSSFRHESIRAAVRYDYSAIVLTRTETERIRGSRSIVRTPRTHLEDRGELNLPWQVGNRTQAGANSPSVTSPIVGVARIVAE